MYIYTYIYGSSYTLAAIVLCFIGIGGYIYTAQVSIDEGFGFGLELVPGCACEFAGWLRAFTRLIKY